MGTVCSLNQGNDYSKVHATMASLMGEISDAKQIAAQIEANAPVAPVQPSATQAFTPAYASIERETTQKWHDAIPEANAVPAQTSATQASAKSDDARRRETAAIWSVADSTMI